MRRIASLSPLLFLLYGCVPNFDESTSDSPESSATFQGRKDFKSVPELKEHVQANGSINVILLNETDQRVLSEFHSDGNTIEYHYDESGEMIDSIDSFGGRQLYQRDNTTNVTSTRTYINNNLIGEKVLADSSDIPAATSSHIASISTTQYEDTIIRGASMNTLITDSSFTNTATMTQATIQGFLESRNSILKDVVLIYYLTPDGSPYFKGDTLNAAAQIIYAATTYGVNPKVILATLQKESSLVSATPGSVDYSSRRF